MCAVHRPPTSLFPLPCHAVHRVPRASSAGRYDEDFVAARLRQLHTWLARMSRHPVVSQSEVFKHFVTCTDEKVLPLSLSLSLSLSHTHTHLSVVCAGAQLGIGTVY